MYIINFEVTCTIHTAIFNDFKFKIIFYVPTLESKNISKKIRTTDDKFYHQSKLLFRSKIESLPRTELPAL